MKDLRPIKGKYYIARLIAEGEHEHQDFKYAISDAAKIAHSISAFANNGGGMLLIGVKDNGVVAGVRHEEDIYVVEQAAQMYCDPPQQLTFTAFATEGGLKVIRVEIPRATRRPVMCRDDAGRYRAYYRVADENLPATDIMTASWRRKDDDTTPGATFTRDMATVLSVIDNRRGISVKEIMTGLHISRGAAEEAVTALYAIGMVDFAYIDGDFRIIATDTAGDNTTSDKDDEQL